MDVPNRRWAMADCRLRQSRLTMNHAFLNLSSAVADRRFGTSICNKSIYGTAIFTSEIFKLLLPSVCLAVVFFFSHSALAQTAITWTFAGPSESSDRFTALAVDPRSDSVIYAAAAAGGIWKTLDAGATWTALFDSQS